MDQGSDPLISVIGSLSDLGEGERVVARLRLMYLGPDWSRQHREKADPRVRSEPANSAYNDQVRIHTKDGVTLAILGVAALVGLRGYFWVQNGETWKARC